MNRVFGSADPVPDGIPDALVHEFKDDARRVVKRSRRRSSEATLFGPLRSAETWWASLVVFSALVIVGGLAGALVYAAVMWPWLMVYVLAPAVVLFAVSLVIAARTRHRWDNWSIW